MTDTTPEPDPIAALIDPAEFGPETIDGERPPGTESSTPASDPEPGDPELDADPEDEPSS
jgi:hypothetical protein